MSHQEKPLSQLNNREWRGFIVALTFLGIFVSSFGIYDGNWAMIKIGLMFVSIGVVAAIILHLFFGIKIVQLRRDFKHSKY